MFLADNTCAWIHRKQCRMLGKLPLDPSTESMVENTWEDLVKPGKTKLMDAASVGDKVRFQTAVAAGDKLTDVDASGWTPLMYAASSYGDSSEGASLKEGCKRECAVQAGRNSAHGVGCNRHGR